MEILSSLKYLIILFVVQIAPSNNTCSPQKL